MIRLDLCFSEFGFVPALFRIRELLPEAKPFYSVAQLILLYGHASLGHLWNRVEAARSKLKTAKLKAIALRSPLKARNFFQIFLKQQVYEHVCLISSQQDDFF